ncbi:MAG: hypothetical protein HYY64_09910, partial [Candidatus Rokubacteria bacterium]|nr:hypothetical protein [Candidatus Rokubacteria bacterium]
MIPRLLGAALVLLLPVAAAAHGEHGSARPLGETGVVTVEGYQLELLSHPAPLAVGQESHVVVKVFKNSPLAPVSGGTVRIGLAPANASHELRPAAEETWAGNYAVAYTPGRRGAHQVRVVLEELEGRTFRPPLTVDFQVAVGKAPGLGAAVWTLLVLAG